MAHRKKPQALRRSRNLSNPVFCTYIRKNNIKAWTNRLQRLDTTRNSYKCFAHSARTKKLNRAKQTFGLGVNKKNQSIQSRRGQGQRDKKNVFKLIHAVVYSSHYSKKVLPIFSKAITAGFVKSSNKRFAYKKSKKNSLFFFFVLKNYFIIEVAWEV